MANRSRGVAGIVLLLLVLPVCAVGAVVYVDVDATGANDGSSWRDAYRRLQDALGAGQEVRVAQGIYKPDQGNGFTPGDKGATFELVPGVTVKGGYAGFGEPAPDARDIVKYKTILSGDLAGNDVQVAEPCDLFYEPTRGENSENVVTVRCCGEESPVLDGFTITGGNADYSGGGLVIDYFDVIIIDCIFINNSAGYNGGAVSFWNSRTRFTRCSFICNWAAGNGGAIDMDGCGTCRDSYGAFVDCRFINNWAGRDGGALCNVSNTLTTMINCTIAGNMAENSGGALFDNSYYDASLVNCTVTGNSAELGGGVYVEPYYQYSWPRLTNCIFWGNTNGELNGEDIDAVYSDIEGGWPGAGNIDSDPGFVWPGYRDVHGVWVDGDYHLLPGSPCIDAGDPNYVAEDRLGEMPTAYYFGGYDPRYVALSSEEDLDGNSRVVGGRVDMGAYEFQRTEYEIYVDDDAPEDPAPGDPSVSDPLEDGSQAHPFDAIQEAIDAAENGDTVIVLDGRYTGDGNRDIEFRGKAVMVRSQNGPEDCIIDCQANRADPHRGFYIHEGEGADSILQGFTITNGCMPSDNWQDTSGGGAILCHGSAIIRNNKIVGNHAYYGGGITAWGSPTIIGNLIAENMAVEGGGINCYEWGLIKNNIIRGNRASRYGGGIWTWEDYPATIVNNVISENEAGSAGGGIGSAWDETIIIGNLIVRNTTAGNGGGIYLAGSADVMSNTIVGNRAGSGGGIYDQWSIFGLPVRNSIVWGNGDDLYNCRPTYCCVEDEDPGKGNIHLEPLFADAASGDFHLKSQAGRWNPKTWGWVKDVVTSPCVDAGDPMGLIGYEPFPNGGRVNMGAYGGTAEASKSYFGTAVCETVVAGDLNGDCKVDFADFVFLALHWLEDGNP
jgi:hypothetical protein